MPAAPFPENEASRLEALRALAVLDAPPEPELDALVQAAAAICGTPIALISLVDADRQWFMASVGLGDLKETPRTQAFCAYTLDGPPVLEVEDAMADPRFSDNPLVCGIPGIRFYSGAALVESGGHRLGTLCVIDRVPRRLDPAQRQALSALATAVIRLIEGRRRDHHDVQALVARLRRLSAIARFTSHAVIVTDVDGHIVWVNEGFERLSGYTQAEVLGRRPGHVLQVPETDADVVRVMREAIARHEGCRVEILNATKDGRRYWVDLEIQPVRAPDGELQGYMGMQIDITQRRLDEEALRHGAMLLARTGEAAGIGGWMLDLRSGRLEWTKETRRLHRVPDDYQPDVETAIAFYAPEAQPVVREAVKNSVRDGAPWDVVLPMIRADGSPFWGRAFGKTEFEDGKPVRLYGAFQDVTDRVEQRTQLTEALTRLKLATEAAGLGVWEVDLQARASRWDEMMCQLFDHPQGRPAPGLRAWLRAVHPDDRGRVVACLRLAMRGEAPADVPFRAREGEDGWRYLRLAARRDAVEGQPGRRLVGVIADETLPHRLADALETERERLHVTLNSIADAVITTDPVGRVSWMNPVAERLTGWPLAHAASRPIVEVFRIINEDTRNAAPDPVEAALAEQRVTGLAANSTLLQRGGGEVAIEDSAAPIHDADGRVIGAVLVFRDVSEQRRLAREMHFRAQHDPLTGALNRSEFEVRLARALERAKDDGVSNTVLMMDLDQFKLVNDACGHAAGDELLKQVAGLIQQTVRTRDLLARIGGDEFALLMEHCTPVQARRAAQQICERLDDYRFIHEGRRFRVGASIGLAPLDARFSTPQQALQAADSACFAAKDAGRNRVHEWFDSDELLQARRTEPHWAQRLQDALDGDGFVLYGQRIQPITPGGEVHAEVLLRLPDAGGLLGPGQFMPAAERFHLMSRIDRWVLAGVLGVIHSWSGGGGGVDRLGVNLSGQSISDPCFREWVMTTLRKAGPQACRRLVLEITETVAVTRLAEAAEFFEQARRLGVQVALDDFGAGASSFGYLKSFPVDVLKIDGQFIRDVLDDRLDAAAVRGFVEVAGIVGLKTVAEHVESAEVLEWLRANGVGYAQGYHLHRPEPLEHLLLGLGAVAGKA